MISDRELLWNIKMLAFHLKQSMEEPINPLNDSEMEDLVNDLLSIIGMFADKELCNANGMYSLTNINRLMSEVYDEFDKSVG